MIYAFLAKAAGSALTYILIGVAVLAVVGGVWIKILSLQNEILEKDSVIKSLSSDLDSAVNVANQNAENIKLIEDRQKAEREVLLAKHAEDLKRASRSRVVVRKIYEAKKDEIPSACGVPAAIRAAIDGLREEGKAGGGDKVHQGNGQSSTAGVR